MKSIFCPLRMSKFWLIYKRKVHLFRWRISTGISIKRKWGENFWWKCFKELNDIHTLQKIFFSSMLRLKVWKGNQIKRQRFLQGLVWLEECTKFPCWFIRSLSTERQSPSRRKSLSLSPCSSSALDDKEDNENDLITWMISLDQEIDNSANTKIRGWSVMWTRIFFLNGNSQTWRILRCYRLKFESSHN